MLSIMNKYTEFVSVKESFNFVVSIGIKWKSSFVPSDIIINRLHCICVYTSFLLTQITFTLCPNYNLYGCKIHCPNSKRTQNKGVWQQDAVKNIWTEETEVNMECTSVHRAASKFISFTNYFCEQVKDDEIRNEYKIWARKPEEKRPFHGQV